MAGQFASALMFIMALMALIIVGISFLAYAGRCLVTVVEDTAGGNDEATWPDEPMQDWIGGVVLLVWLLVIWLVPYGLILRVTKPAIIAQYPALGVLLGGLVLWACFPISLLSSLGSESRWNFIHWRIISGMLRLAPWTALFYATSLLVVVVGLGAWIFAIILLPVVLVPIAAFIGAVAILLYARLMGRLAQRISVLQPLPRLKPKPPPERPPLEVELVKVNDPWGAAGAASKKSPDKIAEPTPSQVLPQPRVASTSNVDDEWEEGGTYGVGEESARTGPTQTELYAEPPPPVEEDEPEEEVEPVRRKKRKGKSKDKKKAEPTPGILTFPFYSCNRRALATLTIIGTAAGMVFQWFLASMPSGG